MEKIDRGRNRELIDEEGNLFFPKVDMERIKIKKLLNSKVKKELKITIRKSKFTDKRKKELLKLEKDLIDLNLMKKKGNKEEMLDYLNEMDEELDEYLKTKK